MHTIDLLKGDGIPPRTTLGSVVFTTLVFVLPLLIGAWMLGTYSTNKINIYVKGRQVTDLQDNADKVDELERELSNYKPEWNDIRKCVATYIQWTPVLIPVVDDMNDLMIMDRLAATNDEGGGTSRNNTNSTDPNAIAIPQRTLAAEFSLENPDIVKLRQLIIAYEKKLEAKKELFPKPINLESFQTPENPDKSYTMNFVFNKK